jgi:hypothetical protein
MNLSDISVGDTVQFITKVDNSNHGQDIQQVILKVTEVTDTLIRGVNALRALNTDDTDRNFRSYKISNIARETVWKLVA